ncbi:MAG: CidA/LrgA family protein [Betaproteobacteria bacterium]|jgi:holin-like protein|nr:CidA/LrgA family protein [Betaproteobacteria bacterium]
MIKTVVIAVALAILGDAIVEMLDIPVPGAAIGMMLLATIFAARGGVDAGAASLFDAAAPHFPLFFIPAAVGVVASAELLSHAWLYVAVAIVASTAATIAITGMLAQRLLNLLAKAKTA